MSKILMATRLCFGQSLFQGRGDMIKLLLAHSPDKTLKNKHGVSPEDLAKTTANYDVSKFLQ